MNKLSDAMVYDADLPPAPRAWLAASISERTRAVRVWLGRRDLPWPCGEHLAEEWREIEDQLAADYPPETGRLVKRMVDAGLSRTVAIWALCTLAGGERFRQHARMTRAKRVNANLPGMAGLFDERDFAILATAFQAAGSRNFAPAHAAVISHHHRHYAPGSSMNAAQAAGFCLGLAASPVRLSILEREEYLLGRAGGVDTPAYLPVSHACDRLYQWITDSLFEGRDPIPFFCRPSARDEQNSRSGCGDWSRGLLGATQVSREAWEAHLRAWPELRAEYERTIDFLGFFACRDRPLHAFDGSANRSGPPEEDPAEAAAAQSVAARRLFLLGHPLLLPDEAASA